ncbi:MAG: hypothetical protein NC177_05985 [Ruminococcus flavefaciens]|nr:hypothetical protein [Ruminococcus flavefaciens]
MNNFKKRIIALIALTCVALSAFAGCADKEESSDTSSKKLNSSESSEVSEEPMTAMPFQWGEQKDNGITIDGVDINNDDPVKADHVDPTKSADESSAVGSDTQDTTAYIAGEPITEIVAVTEANGEAVTEANGEPVTEVKTITNATPEPTANNDNGNGNSNSNTSSDYVSNTKGMYALWIDISKNENFVFNDSVIKITFKVKETAPDGIYNISISPDLSSIEGQTVDPDTIVNGSIQVGNGSAVSADQALNGFSIYGDNITAKQGDTVEFSINMKDNPGLAALCMWYYYDSNALEVIDCVPDGEFAEVSKNSTQTG